MTPLRVLIIEDSQDDALLLADQLRRGGFHPQTRVVDDFSDLESALSEEWDVIISDYVLPDFSGMDALKLARERTPDTTFLMVSGRMGEDIAVETMKAGASDYILKSNIARLVPAVQRAIREAEVRRERRLVRKALAESEERYRTLFERSNDGILVIQDGIIQLVNQSFAEMSGYSVEELLNTPFTEHLPPEEAAMFYENYSRRIAGEDIPSVYEAAITRRGGIKLEIEISASIINYEGRPGDMVISRDITERKLAQRELEKAREFAEHSAKMETELRKEIEEALERERGFSLLLQGALLPATPMMVEGYSIAVEYVPVFVNQEIGGDFYDVYNVSNCRAGILIGDVSGKGLAAAAMAATTRSTIHAFVHETVSPGEALTRTDAVLGSSPTVFESFVTVCLVALDTHSGDFSYSSTGHPPAIICRSTGEVDMLELGGMPLGLGMDRQFEEHCGHLEEGDKLVLYTDGISEARRGPELLELEGIQRILRENLELPATDLAQALLKGATEWAGGKLSDDAAIIVAERLSTTSRSAAAS